MMQMSSASLPDGSRARDRRTARNPDHLALSNIAAAMQQRSVTAARNTARGTLAPAEDDGSRLCGMTQTDLPNAASTDADLAATTSTAYQAALEVIATVEPRVAEATRAELADQRASLKLIASENYASPAVLMTMGTWFSDKYAEGTIGHRFYAGCQNVDTVEALAAEHARELFGAEYAYAQPHSGIDANLVAFWAILATRVEAPALASLGRQERQRPVRGRLGEAAPRVRQPADARDVARRRRPPHPRLPAEHLGQDVPPAQLRHRPRDAAARLRPGRARWRASSSRWS